MFVQDKPKVLVDAEDGDGVEVFQWLVNHLVAFHSRDSIVIEGIRLLFVEFLDGHHYDG